MAGSDAPRPASQQPPNVDPATASLEQALTQSRVGGAPVNVYANGFSLGMSNADVFMVLLLFGRPVGIVNVSYTLAKTLSEKLAALVEDWEKRTGQVLQTTDSIEKNFKESKENK